MTLQQELSKAEYQTLTNAERLALLKSKTERVVGKIAYGNTLHLVSMLARGLRMRIDTCAIPALKYAWQEALQPAYLSSPSYSINVALPEIRAMLDQGKTAGICTQAEYDFIVELASYDKVLFPDATMRDVVAYFNPELIAPIDTWQPLATSNATVNIWLKTKAPEPTHIVIQHQDVLPDGSLSDWRHSTAVHGIELVGEYQAAIPTKAGRQYRWRCEYLLDCVVS